jgi:acyl carrier protein
VNPNSSPSVSEQQYLDDIIEVIKENLCMIPGSIYTNYKQISIYESWKVANVDSLDALDLMCRCEKHFNITIDDEEASSIETIEQLAQMIKNKLNKKVMEEKNPKSIKLTKEDVLLLIQNALEKQNKINREDVTPTSFLYRDLHLDSFDRLELCLWAEKTFNIDIDIDDISTVQDLINKIIKS